MGAGCFPQVAGDGRDDGLGRVGGAGVAPPLGRSGRPADVEDGVGDLVERVEAEPGQLDAERRTEHRGLVGEQVEGDHPGAGGQRGDLSGEGRRDALGVDRARPLREKGLESSEDAPDVGGELEATVAGPAMEHGQATRQRLGSQQLGVRRQRRG